MTTQELINQYVTSHAESRWMDASELEVLLTEFSEKLKEPTSDDLEQAAIDYDSCRPALYGEDDEGDYVEYIEVRKEAFIAGSQWQKEKDNKELQSAEARGIVAGKDMLYEHMMKFALNAYIAINTFPDTWMPELVICDSDDMKALIERLELEHEDKVKVIIVKDDGRNIGNN